ncbi:hypothetical protein Astex_3804 (plasmid) [Asticcacaulis excentricus CB 48]|uniref:Uncharacterized protein n=1 Tax=Asticcacaulis excentricus (strain ATCC 15261 / DSM 4724 / KCTC 12464 / NCIMB 9791 / VKM B-1370 / CB 48) TaxID=573065 RepID=E8RVZ2_ASTEC|nr:hypothetical protein Astex_3804 [Asticcacaulis excentricus CB 48]
MNELYDVRLNLPISYLRQGIKNNFAIGARPEVSSQCGTVGGLLTQSIEQPTDRHIEYHRNFIQGRCAHTIAAQLIFLDLLKGNMKRGAELRLTDPKLTTT